MRRWLEIALFAPQGQRCGIADYSDKLSHSFSDADAGDWKPNVSRRPLMVGPLLNVFGLVRCLFGRQYDVVHLQYHPGLLAPLSSRQLARLLGVLNNGLLTLLLMAHSFFRSRLPATGHLAAGPLAFATIHGLSVPVRARFRVWMKRFDCLLVHFESARQALIAAGVPYQRVQVVPCGTTWFGKTATSSMAKQGSHRVLLFGFVHPWKGHHVAIQALLYLPQNYRLVICGAPRQRAHEVYFREIHRLAARLGLLDRVEFAGFVPDERLNELVSRVSCAIFPYTWPDEWLEWSGACSVALGYGLPVVASAVRSFQDLSSQYSCVQLVRSGDAEALARAIADVCEDPALRAQLLECGRLYIEDTSWRRVAQLTLRTYLGFMVNHPDTLYLGEGQPERLEWLRRQVEGAALEVGCALGYVAESVGASIAVDLRVDRLIIAANLRPTVKFVAADATRLPFPSKSFDTVLLPELLDHLPYGIAQEACQEAVRVCRKRLLITVGRAEDEGYLEDDTVGARNREHLWAATSDMVSGLLGGGEATLSPSTDGRFWLATVSLRDERA